jgi:hypothetical protein
MRRKLFEADRRGQGPFAGGIFRSGPAPLRARERVFPAKEVEHRAPDSVFRVCRELQAAGWLEALYRLYQADRAGADQIVKGDAGWHLGP